MRKYLLTTGSSLIIPLHFGEGAPARYGVAKLQVVKWLVVKLLVVKLLVESSMPIPLHFG
jgi:hypothetical protein